MKEIYKIVNIINNKVYIGQSINSLNRFKQHCENKNSLIGKAIQKYGKENFQLEILGRFEDYNEKEKYYINFYRSLSPYGYNLAKGGEEPPLLTGENHPSAKISKKLAEKIQQELLNYNLQLNHIIKINKVTRDIVRHINDGRTWRNDNFNYPLRPTETGLNEIRAKEVIKLLSETKLSQKEIGQKVGWSRSAITMINIGKNHHQEDINYPIRK